jgi:hypothetical protein
LSENAFIGPLGSAVPAGPAAHLPAWRLGGAMTTEACLNNAPRLDTYIRDAERDEDTDLAEFFRRAQAERRKGAEQGNQLLASRLHG